MELVIEQVVAALQAAGLAAAAALPGAAMAHLQGPMTAVSLQSATASPGGFYDYLGIETLENGSVRELYGRLLEAQLGLAVYSPAKDGGAACRQAADAVGMVLLQGIAGLQVGNLTWDACSYDAGCDCMTVTCTVALRAYIYAVASEDGTEFTDFILKGVLK